MKFQPQTKEELSMLLAEGEGSFEVIDTEEKKSKAGNDMLHLTLRVTDKNGRIAMLEDYLAVVWKIRNFAHSSGLIQEYDAGEITAQHCGGSSGKCVIGVKKGEMGERGQYPDKNIIASYIESESKGKTKTKQDEFFDDDIAF